MNFANAPMVFQTLPLKSFRRARVSVRFEGLWDGTGDVMRKGREFAQGGMVLVLPSAGEEEEKGEEEGGVEKVKRGVWIKMGLEVWKERIWISVG